MIPFVQLINGERLKRKLANLDKNVQRREVIRKASREAAKPLHKVIKATTEFQNRTWTLRKSIKIRAARKSRTRVGVNIIIRAIDWEVAQRKGLIRNQRHWGWVKGKRPLAKWNVFYGGFVEYGTHRIRPRKYMKTPSHQMRKSVINHMMQEALRIIKEGAYKQ